jgi:protein pelota
LRVLEVDEVGRRVKLVPESSVDLVNVYRSVKAGDLVFAETTREIKKERATGEVDSRRVVVRIGIEVERKSADPATKRVSFLGRIVSAEGYEDLLKKHHTIHVERGREVEIVSREGFARFAAIARRARTAPAKRILVLSADDERAVLVLISDEGTRLLKQAESSSGVKFSGYSGVPSPTEAVRQLLEDVEETLERYGVSELVVVAPSALLDSIGNEVRRALSGRVEVRRRTIPASSGGLEGVTEVIRRGGLGKDLRPLGDALLVERVLEKVARSPEGFGFGLRDVLNMLNEGRLGYVLIAEEFLWQRIDDEELDSVLRAAESGAIGARVLLAGGEDHERVMGLGGVLGIDRATAAEMGLGREEEGRY